MPQDDSGKTNLATPVLTPASTTGNVVVSPTLEANPQVATVSDTSTVIPAARVNTPEPPPADPPSDFPHKKFPFMMVTLIAIFLVIVFGGSYLYFNMNQSNKMAVSVQITPAVTHTPSATPTVYKNPFVSPTLALENPFASPTAVLENPFGTYDNPFTEATNAAAAENQAYTNPFEGL